MSGIPFNTHSTLNQLLANLNSFIQSLNHPSPIPAPNGVDNRIATIYAENQPQIALAGQQGQNRDFLDSWLADYSFSPPASPRASEASGLPPASIESEFPLAHLSALDSPADSVSPADESPFHHFSNASIEYSDSEASDGDSRPSPAALTLENLVDQLLRGALGQPPAGPGNGFFQFPFQMNGEDNQFRETLFNSLAGDSERTYERALEENRSGGKYLAELLERKLKSLPEEKRNELLEQIETFDPELMVNWPRWAIEEAISAPMAPSENNTDKMLHKDLKELNHLRNQTLIKSCLAKTAQSPEELKELEDLTKAIEEGIGKIATNLIAKNKDFMAAMKIGIDFYKERLSSSLPKTAESEKAEPPLR